MQYCCHCHLIWLKALWSVTHTWSYHQQFLPIGLFDDHLYGTLLYLVNTFKSCNTRIYQRVHNSYFACNNTLILILLGAQIINTDAHSWYCIWSYQPRTYTSLSCRRLLIHCGRRPSNHALRESIVPHIYRIAYSNIYLLLSDLTRLLL